MKIANNLFFFFSRKKGTLFSRRNVSREARHCNANTLHEINVPSCGRDNRYTALLSVVV